MGKKKTRQTKNITKKNLSRRATSSWREWFDSLSDGQKKVGKGLLVLAGVLMAPFILLNIWLVGDSIVGQIVARATITDAILDKNLLDMKLVNSYSVGEGRLMGGSPAGVHNSFKKPLDQSDEEIIAAISKKAVEYGWSIVSEDVSEYPVSLIAKKESPKGSLHLDVFITHEVFLKVEGER